jgi:hypothetical protein
MGWDDTPYTPAMAGDLMATHGDPNINNDAIQNLLLLTAHEKQRLLEDCLRRHKNH